MFKENKEFWLYIIGTVIMLIVIYLVVNNYQFPFVGFLTDQGRDSLVYNQLPLMQLEEGKDYRARIATNNGDILIDLYEDKAPQTVNNFVFLAEEGYYQDVSFHRVIRDFLIQTGSRTTLDDDPSNDAMGEPGYVFDDEINWDSLGLSMEQRQTLEEAGYSNDTHVESRRLEKYSVAMANAGPDTNGSQFFIVLADDTDSRLRVLQGRHTVFGTIIGGYDVLRTINNAPIENEEDDSVSRPRGNYFIEAVEIQIL